MNVATIPPRRVNCPAVLVKNKKPVVEASLIVLAIALFGPLNPHAHAGNQGPRFPGTLVSEPGTGLSPESPWIDTDLAAQSDDMRATTTFSSGGSEYLKATGFRFRLPDGAVVTNIHVQIEKSTTAGSAPGDSSVKIVKGGVPTGTDMRITGSLFEAIWPMAEPVALYSGGLWGETWTSADINSPDFGVAIAAGALVAGTSIARIDRMSILVSFDASPFPLPPPPPPPPPPPGVPAGARWTLGVLGGAMCLAGLAKLRSGQPPRAPSDPGAP